MKYTHTATDTKGVELRDEIYDIISLIDLPDTPITSAIGTRAIKQPQYSHLVDSLAAANADNAQKQGEDAPAASDTTRTKTAANTQIFSKTVDTSGSLEAAAQYGLDTESKYQEPKKMIELKRDLEASVISSNATVCAVAGTTAGKSPGLGSIITTNVDSTTVTTLAAAQTAFNDLLQDVIEGGGRPDNVYVCGVQKRGMGGWTTKTTFNVTNPTNNKQAVRGIDLYWPDIGGPLRFHHHYMMATTHLFLLEHDSLKIAWFRKWFRQPLAVTGDAKQTQLLGECGLFTKNEKANGMMSGLTT